MLLSNDKADDIYTIQDRKIIKADAKLQKAQDTLRSIKPIADIRKRNHVDLLEKLESLINEQQSMQIQAVGSHLLTQYFIPVVCIMTLLSAFSFS